MERTNYNSGYNNYEGRPSNHSSQQQRGENRYPNRNPDYKKGGYKKNNSNNGGGGYKKYNKPYNKQKNGYNPNKSRKPYGNVNAPDPICPEELFVTNSYGMAISVVLAEYVPDEYKGSMSMDSDVFPFYIFDRMRMKSTVNVIQSMADLVEFSYGDAWSELTELDDFREITTGKHFINEFFPTHTLMYNAVNWKTIGVTPYTSSDNKIMRVLDKDGNLFTWYRDKADKPNLKATNEFAIVEKGIMSKLAHDIMNTIVAADGSLHNAYRNYDTRDKAALWYPWHFISSEHDSADNNIVK